MTDVLLTGITGFIGSHLSKKLVDDGYKVYGVLKPSAGRDFSPIKEIFDKVILVTADLTNFHSVKNMMKSINPDVVIHLAGLTPFKDSYERPYEYEESLFNATMNIVNSFIELSDLQTRGILLASSAEVYGWQNILPLHEELRLNPTSPYSVCKVAAELYLRMAILTYGLNGAILRPANTYGRKFDKSYLIEYLVTEMLQNKTVYIGAPETIRDYMFVDDHANAYMAALKKINELHGEVFNAGTGFSISNKDLAAKIAEIIKLDSNKIVFGSYPPGYPFRPFVSQKYDIVLDSSKIKKYLGWEAKVSLDSGLQKVVEYWRNKA